MQRLTKGLMLSLGLAVCLVGSPAFAQKYEVHPYAGGAWMTDYQNVLDFKNPGIFGVKGGGFVTDNFELEGNVGYMNQFNMRGYNYRSHAYLYEFAVNYNMWKARAGRVYPFVSAGVGGTTVDTENFSNPANQNAAIYLRPSASPIVLEDGDTFFNFSYGGGVKGSRLWGPVGLRADIRGRTMPNFFGEHIHSFEATGGLLFSWGER